MRLALRRRRALRRGRSPHRVVYLGPTVAGKQPDKKAAEDAQIASPANVTLDKDTGFQGYEPASVLTRQPKKAQRQRAKRGGAVPHSPLLPCARSGGIRDCWG
jgi:hypothetical protein